MPRKAASSATSVSRKLESLEKELLAAPRRAVCCQPDWHADSPSVGGVYVIRDRKTNRRVYVGATSGLLARMNDLGRTPNHTFRRTVRKWFKLDNVNEAELNTFLSRRYDIAWIAVPFGRAELEEYLIIRYRSSLLNKPARRPGNSEQYGWVEEVTTRS